MDPRTQAARRHAVKARFAVVAAVLLAGVSCAARGAPVRAAALTAEPPSPPAATPRNAPAAPQAAPPTARALDPERAAGPCGGYSFDGLTIGMSRPQVEAAVPLIAVAPADSLLSGFESTTFGFRASRRGRIDDVQVGFGPQHGALEFIRAGVLVGHDDLWPRVLFDSLGSPKLARVGEYVWYDLGCGFTLRLIRLESLGEGDAMAYTVEVRRSAKPVE